MRMAIGRARATTASIKTRAAAFTCFRRMRTKRSARVADLEAAAARVGQAAQVAPAVQVVKVDLAVAASAARLMVKAFPEGVPVVAADAAVLAAVADPIALR